MAICVCLQSGLINSFPFDPVGLNSPKHAVNEVKNGRLAMVSGRCGSGSSSGAMAGAAVGSVAERA